MAQISKYQRYKKLHFPEKVWVLTHPFVAKKTFELTQIAQQRAEIAITDPDFDGNFNGGQVDAYRHALWMALLSANLRKNAARNLGKAHEKGNKIDFDHKNLEEEKLPSFIMSKMDLLNNELGLEIGSANPGVPIEILESIVKKKILAGKGVIIKTNNKGEFITRENRVISEDEYLGKWFTPKTLVPSNYIHP